METYVALNRQYTVAAYLTTVCDTKLRRTLTNQYFAKAYSTYLVWFAQPQGQQNLNGRCYKYVATHLTWADAELYCVSQGANLVSIHSLEEQEFVNSLIKDFDHAQGFTWNGLSDTQKEGGWMWSDGSAVDFKFWDAGDPDDNKGAEDCEHNNTGK
uniref:C-type lectin domain-containing protein n=1 Tax=Sparus aurata TaxID=8175 RepID=A0A671WFJ0_SPAAU